jgi:hypothetical protein
MEISCPLSAIIVKDCFDTREVVTDMLKCIQEIKDISVRNAALLLLGTYFIYKIVTIKLYLFSEEDMTTYFLFEGPLWSWSYGSWIYNYLGNQCLSPLTWRVRTLLDTTLCDKVYQWSVVFFIRCSGFLHHDITEILLKMALTP